MHDRNTLSIQYKLWQATGLCRAWNNQQHDSLFDLATFYANYPADCQNERQLWIRAFAGGMTKFLVGPPGWSGGQSGDRLIVLSSQTGFCQHTGILYRHFDKQFIPAAWSFQMDGWVSLQFYLFIFDLNKLYIALKDFDLRQNTRVEHSQTNVETEANHSPRTSQVQV